MKSSLPWFRLYTDLLNDPQVQTLSDAHFRAYLNTLCIAAAHNPRGELPPLKGYAFALHRTEQQASKTLASLLAAGLLEVYQGVTKVKNWEELQPVSDGSCERVQQHRQRMKRLQPVTETVTVTAQKRDRSDIDLDKKRGEQNETVTGSLSASQDHFKITEERWQKAQSIGVPSKAWVEQETAKFILEHGDHLHTYKDPDKAWLKWLHRGKEYAEKHPNVVPIANPPRRKMFFAEG